MKRFVDFNKLTPSIRHFMQNVTTLFTFATNILLHFLSDIKKVIQRHKKMLTKILIPFLIIGCGYYACSASQRAILKNVAQIFKISDEIRSYYADKPDYWGLNTDFVIKNRIVRKKFIRKRKLVLNKKTEIFVGYGEKAEIVMPLMQTFDIVLPNLNKAQCISYAEAPILEENSLKLYSISIVNSSGNFVFEWGGARPLPVAKYATKNLCLDEKNTLIWTVK